MSRKCNVESNKAKCNCTYEPCSRKGICCECIEYHRRMNELPACVFPEDAERTYDRSFAYFARLVNEGRI
ncbi:MAG: cytosolic protein [Deltaproteobacteria bacterium]|nr:cytosolic protein [Deltaproteobacteria bacterium]